MFEHKTDLICAFIFFGLGGLIAGHYKFKLGVFGTIACGVIAAILGACFSIIINRMDDRSPKKTEDLSKPG